MNIFWSRVVRFLLLIVILNCFACGSHNNSGKDKHKTLILEAKPISTTLFYSGIIQPLKTVVVTSPAEGVILDTSFHYGDRVSEGKLLFTISSEKFRSDYKTALMQYIKAKSEFDMSQSQLTQSKFLLKNELISGDEFKSKEKNFYAAELSLYQAKDALNTLMRQESKTRLKLDDYKIEDIQEIAKILQARGDSETLNVISPESGIVLLPIKSENDNETKKMNKGDSVKKEDVLAVIGDTRGFTIHVNVGEFTINQLHVGQKVKITGAAFPEFILQGKIASIERQAQLNTNGMPVFPVEIIVPSLSAKEREMIHIGMSAKIEINIESGTKMTVPIAAVFEKNGDTYVNIQNMKTGKISETLVETGQTTIDSVIIESGLQAGDHIVYAG